MASDYGGEAGRHQRVAAVVRSLYSARPRVGPNGISTEDSDLAADDSFRGFAPTDDDARSGLLGSLLWPSFQASISSARIPPPHGDLTSSVSNAIRMGIQDRSSAWEGVRYPSLLLQRSLLFLGMGKPLITARAAHLADGILIDESGRMWVGL